MRILTDLHCPALPFVPFVRRNLNTHGASDVRNIVYVLFRRPRCYANREGNKIAHRHIKPGQIADVVTVRCFTLMELYSVKITDGASGTKSNFVIWLA